MHIKRLFFQVLPQLLAGVMLYTATRQWLDWEAFQGQLLNQPLPKTLSLILTGLLPSVEVLLAGLLLFEKSRPLGFALTMGFMSMTSGYIVLVLSEAFAYVPCSCVGMLDNQPWEVQLALNSSIFFLALAGYRIRENRLCPDTPARYRQDRELPKT
ncbi:MauE/DoxX family redox-associated membrane protein [Rapidithrix thailandica]|uniref:MauE/DoxX family redox-associated membrane protein n=1 Tax=Rapidithrix thailandica TaxID=413964 RepID=A0AAW9S0L6_9BACT